MRKGAGELRPGGISPDADPDHIEGNPEDIARRVWMRNNGREVVHTSESPNTYGDPRKPREYQ